MPANSRDAIGIVGAGAWGTALAHSLSVAGRAVRLWAYEAETAREINESHTNRNFLSGVVLDAGVVATASFTDLAECGLILLVSPAQHVRRVAVQLRQWVGPEVSLVICAKGLEEATGKLLSDVLAEEMPGTSVATLSGPSFASEVARGLPAALTLGCDSEDLAERISNLLHSQNLRVYWTDDVVGVQLGGAIKNVLAIAAGVIDGRQMGASAHAALVTRGFAEMRRLAEAFGARGETLFGLSGLGDLLLTCSSRQSRNMSLGRALGVGESLNDILAHRRSVAEGIYTARAVVAIADQYSVEVPISRAVAAVVNGDIKIDRAIDSLMSRPLRSELDR
ncbi:MAG: NAD(P)H-dependent glycerol-3-phosphate dehydrogenase [Hyphomicrobiaceae bacterium]